LVIRLDAGGDEPLTQLSWAAADGSQAAIGFSPDLASFYGHHRTCGGHTLQMRGEFDERGERPEGEEGARAYEFDTQVEDGVGGWSPAGRLRVLVDHGGDAQLQWLAWHERSGDAYSIGLRAASRSGNADVSYLVNAVQASTENTAAGEVAANLAEPSSSKWLGLADRACLQFQLSRPVRIENYALTSANDMPDRDPSGWILRGSTGGRWWRTLDTRSGQRFSGRHESRTYSIAEPGSFDHLQFDITGTNGARHLQLEAVRFLTGTGAEFVGYRQLTGQLLVGYRGVRVVWASTEAPTRESPEDGASTAKERGVLVARASSPVPDGCGGNLSSPGAEMVEPYGGGTGFRFKIRDVRIDGHGDSVCVREGGMYEVSFDILHDCSECGNAVNQVIVGLAGEDRAQASVWNGKQRSGGGPRVVNAGTRVAAMAEDNPGPAEWVNVSFGIVVPDEPGTYFVRARYAQAYQGRLMTAEGRGVAQPESHDVLGWWKVDRPDGPGPESTIGTIIVEGRSSD
jgi:hypothetical protein